MNRDELIKNLRNCIKSAKALPDNAFIYSVIIQADASRDDGWNSKVDFQIDIKVSMAEQVRRLLN